MVVKSWEGLKHSHRAGVQFIAHGANKQAFGLILAAR
jgi:hypothetical protein